MLIFFKTGLWLRVPPEDIVHVTRQLNDARIDRGTEVSRVVLTELRVPSLKATFAMDGITAIDGRVDRL